MNISGSFVNIHSDSDLKAIIEIDQKHFPRPWKEADWNNMSWEHSALFAWKDQDLKGFALFHNMHKEPTAHLLKICLLPESRGTGLATVFWGHITKELKGRGVESIYLEVEKTNVSAVKFYSKLGFLTYRKIVGFYSDGASAITMGLTL